METRKEQAVIFAISLIEIQHKMIRRLKVGQSYVLNTIEAEDLRKTKKKEEMFFLKAYGPYALFETKSGRRECFLYQDLFYQDIERKKNEKK